MWDIMIRDIPGVGGSPTFPATNPQHIPDDDPAFSFVFRRRSDATSQDPYVENGITILEETDSFEPGIVRVTVTIPHGGTAKIFARLVLSLIHISEPTRPY